MIDVEALRTRYRRIAGFLDERGRRLFAANEALALGRGGVTAVSAASGIARSTINRGIAELRAGSNELGEVSGGAAVVARARSYFNLACCRRSKS